MKNPILTFLQNSITQPLPGIQAHAKMAPIGRPLETENLDDFKVACVLLLIYLKDNVEHIVFIERTSFHEKDQHKGQISFPGGKMESSDENHTDCAVREAVEEIGFNPEGIKIIRPLTRIAIPVSNFLVYPILAFSPHPQKFIRQESEVNSILEIPLINFFKSNFRITKDLQMSRGMVLKNIPGYKLENHFLWGATAMMMSEFVELFCDFPPFADIK